MKTSVDLKELNLAKQLYEVSYLTGDFTLRSGQKSSQYFDKYQFEARPELLKALAKKMASVLPATTEVLAGLELGGVPLATALSLETGLPLIFVRKEAKTYGTCRIAEGVEFLCKRVTLIEDVITTGGQVIESGQILRQQGALVTHVLSVILRGSGEELAAAGFHLNSLYTMQELLDAVHDQS